MTIKLNNPDAKISYEKRCGFFKGRTLEALQSEGLDCSDSGLVIQLADIAATLELRGGGGSADPAVQLKRAVVGELNTIREDGQRVRRALQSLNNALGKCSESTKIEISEGLKAAGVGSERLAGDLVKLQTIVRDLGNEPALKTKQGQVTNERTIAIHRAWGLLAPLGTKQRAASRIIARLLDGDDANHGSIYSTIHEFLARGGRL